MNTRSTLESQPEIFQHLHEIIMFTEKPGYFCNFFPVAEQLQRVMIVDLLLISRSVFRRRHSSNVKQRLLKIALFFFDTSSEFQRGARSDPGSTHPRPVTHGNAVQIIGIPDRLTGQSFALEPEKILPGHDQVTPQIFGTDGENEPSLFHQLFACKRKTAGAALDSKGDVFISLCFDFYSGKTSLGGTLP